MNDELRALIRSEAEHAEAQEDWVDDLPHEAPGLAAMANARGRNSRKERAYAAVYALIDEAQTPAATNALIWSCVHAALTAYNNRNSNEETA